MKKIDVPISALVSILIGVIGLCAFLVCGYRRMVYPTLDMAELSEQNIRAGRYVQGTISGVVTMQVGNTNRRVGNDAGYIVVARTYASYTVPIADEQYIRIWIWDGETQRGMERMVQGDLTEIPFVGQIKRRNMPLNTAWYDHDPLFDQSKVIADYEIWQKSPDIEKNIFLAGLFGMVIAALLYSFSGGIHVLRAEPESAGRAYIRNYNKENELALARKRLEMYEKQGREYRKKALIGILCVILGVFIVFFLEVYELKLAGLALMLYGVKKWWDCFIHSSNRCAMKIAGLLSIETLQTKSAAERAKIKEIEHNTKQSIDA